MSMLKTKGSNMSVSEEVEERYSEDTRGNFSSNLYTVMVNLHSKRII